MMISSRRRISHCCRLERLSFEDGQIETAGTAADRSEMERLAEGKAKDGVPNA